MKKTVFTMLMALMLLCAAASADPAMSASGYTAYLGPQDHLFLRYPDGATRELPLTMTNVVAMDDTQVYALLDDGTLLGVRLDGTKTEILSGAPAPEADLAKVVPADRFALEGQLLYYPYESGNRLYIDGDVLLYTTGVQAVTTADGQTAYEEHLYYVRQMDTSVTLNDIRLSDLPAESIALAPHDAFTPKMTVVDAAAPISITATMDAVALVNNDRSVTVVTLRDQTVEGRLIPAGTVTRDVETSAETAAAMALDGKLYRYALLDGSRWQLQGEGVAMYTLDMPIVMQNVEPDPIPTIESTRTPTVVTPKPSKTPAADKDEDPYPQLKYGDTGSSVRKMQRRLKDLGYPVGEVDGDWGDNTQLAVNLFQHAIGYKERSYATSKMQEKLYSSKAPKYDKYESLREGDQGTPVKLMQQALYDLGYFGTAVDEVDGHYGPKTAAAVKAFQQEIVDSVEDFDDGIKPTGKADRATLKVLFGTMAPMAPDQKPEVKPPLVELITPPPSGEETDKPTDDPVEEITPPPSSEETDKPTDDPVEEITPPPSSEETDKPTDDLVEEITPPPSDDPEPEPTDDGGVELIVPGGN